MIIQQLIFFSEPMLSEVKELHLAPNLNRGRARTQWLKGSTGSAATLQSAGQLNSNGIFMWVLSAPFSVPAWVCWKEQRNIKEIKCHPPFHLSMTRWGDFVCKSGCVEARRCVVTQHWPGNTLYSTCVHMFFRDQRIIRLQIHFHCGTSNLFPVKS